jgi:hypothetical protein
MTKARDIASAAPAPSTVSATELGYLDGVSSAIQTQLDAKTAKSTLTTTGDIYYASSANTPARLGIGSTDQVLKVTGGVPVWATPAGGGANWSLLNAGGTALTGATTITVSGISGKDKVLILVSGASAGNGDYMGIRMNTDTGTNYAGFGTRADPGGSYSAQMFVGTNFTANDQIPFGTMANDSSSTLSGYVLFSGCNASGVKTYTMHQGRKNNDGTGGQIYWLGGYYNSSDTTSSVSIVSNGSNFDAGTIFVYTSA